MDDLVRTHLAVDKLRLRVVDTAPYSFNALISALVDFFWSRADLAMETIFSVVSLDELQQIGLQFWEVEQTHGLQLNQVVLTHEVMTLLEPAW